MRLTAMPVTLIGLTLATSVAWAPPRSLRAPEPPLGTATTQDSTERARAVHVLNRLTYGPRPGDVDRVLAIGIERFIDQQLSPRQISDRELDRRLERLAVLRTGADDFGLLFREAARERLARQREMAPDSSPGEMRPDGQRPRLSDQPPEARRLRRLLGEFQQAAVVRAALSERQLYEVMVDFWTNHFNVFLGKGADRFLAPSYIEGTIRPRALGTFEDLLVATAQSPAMLFYLDNAQSVAPGSRPPQPRLAAGRGSARYNPRRAGRPGFRPGGRAPDPQRIDSLRALVEARRPTGINENYARELLELHTLGVDGGYTQDDIVNAARILTGWSMARPAEGSGFRFNDWAHDRGEKNVLGHHFPAGRGKDEGIELLRLLARHPSTIRHVSGKLCTRFVNDDPPSGCVDAGVHAWERSGGDIREIVRAIVTSAEFWSEEYRGTKVKTPLEFVVSAVRAVGGAPDTTLALAQVVARLGQPLYGQQPPTGYPETQESWVNAGALLQRLNVAMGIGAGRLPGVAADLDAVSSIDAGIDALVAAVNREVLNGTATPNTLRVMREQGAELPGNDARALVVGLALGSPEFQRQ